MKRRSTEFTENSETATFRVDKDISKKAREKAKREDLSFSQLMRRALKREIGIAA
ncbi:hypothetical protein BH09VER1_BH09VER1_28610 [soil metagenome]